MTRHRLHPLTLTLFAAILALFLAPAAFAQPIGGGGPACFSNADCADTEYCASLSDRCGGPGKCEVRPDLCILVFDPVCGCDGQTYSNACFAAQAGVNVAHEGECGTLACTRDNQCPDDFFCLRAGGDCEGEGTCALEPDFCPLVFDPVCGCDGQTYSNACFAAMAGVSVDFQGECPPDDCSDNADCGEGFFCNPAGKSCNGRGSCEPIPEACFEIFAPVCGCDGQIYANACFANAAGVAVANEGEECRGSLR